jgi:hypothetical protein
MLDSRSRLSPLPRLLLALVVVTASLGAVSAPATAQTDQPEWATDTFERMDEWIPTYNEQVSVDDFGPAASQLKNERVNLVITDTNGETATASFRTDENLRVQAFSMGIRDDATIRMTTDRRTLSRVLDSPAPANAFVTAITTGDITISGIGTIATVKWAVINVAADLARAFGL